MTETIDKYRIIEQNNKFQVEILHSFWFWNYYRKSPCFDIFGSEIYQFDCLDDAKQHIKNITVKIHKA